MNRLILLLLFLPGCRAAPPEEIAAPRELSITREDTLDDRVIVLGTSTPRFILDGSIIRIIDGDTAVLRHQVWFGITAEGSCRLVEVEAPEIVGADKAAGLLWKAKLEELAPPGSKVRIKAFAMDKYGRPLVVIERGGVSVNRALVEAMNPN